jgi:hypothetical protein
VQEPELQQDEEQKNDDGTAGNEEVLPVLSQASAASGDKVELERKQYERAVFGAVKIAGKE